MAPKTLLRWMGIGIFTACTGLAQNLAVTLSGAVTDASDAVVLGAKLQLLKVDTGEQWNAVTNQTGNYFIPLVKPGSYSLTAEAPGFKQYHRTGIVLETGVPARADIKLEVGAVSESVTVEDSIPLLKTGTSAVGAVVDRRTIASMPLSDRRAGQLARLTGFMVMAIASDPVQSSPALAMAGGRGIPCGSLTVATPNLLRCFLPA